MRISAEQGVRAIHGDASVPELAGFRRTGAAQIKAFEDAGKEVPPEIVKQMEEVKQRRAANEAADSISRQERDGGSGVRGDQQLRPTAFERRLDRKSVV